MTNENLVVCFGKSNDPFIKALYNSLQSHGVNMHVFEHVSELEFFCAMKPNGDTDCYLKIEDQWVNESAIKGCFNFVALTDFSRSQSKFESCESQAAIWALLAILKCFVVNRPNSATFYPGSLAATSQINLPSPWVHMVDICSSDDSTMIKLEQRTFGQARHIFVCGKRMYDLSRDDRQVPAYLYEPLETLLSTPLFKGFNFGLLVIEEVSETTINLVHASPFVRAIPGHVTETQAAGWIVDAIFSE